VKEKEEVKEGVVGLEGERKKQRKHQKQKY
jgi:hypothetical protein